MSLGSLLVNKICPNKSHKGLKALGGGEERESEEERKNLVRWGRWELALMGQALDSQEVVRGTEASEVCFCNS